MATARGDARAIRSAASYQAEYDHRQLSWYSTNCLAAIICGTCYHLDLAFIIGRCRGPHVVICRPFEAQAVPTDGRGGSFGAGSNGVAFNPAMATHNGELAVLGYMAQALILVAA
ncbi:hypothetical protein RUM43_006455 [Polyplax serrata]|uniref:Uncharacterized protein n=1 Tax=Polyplax serrata TaxID=468196 RepID=A0AAN8NY94_POLSC